MTLLHWLIVIITFCYFILIPSTPCTYISYLMHVYFVINQLLGFVIFLNHICRLLLMFHLNGNITRIYCHVISPHRFEAISIAVLHYELRPYLLIEIIFVRVVSIYVCQHWTHCSAFRLFSLLNKYNKEVYLPLYPQSSSTLWNYSKCGVYTVESEAGC
jgi:hypothetical protein